MLPFHLQTMSLERTKQKEGKHSWIFPSQKKKKHFKEENYYFSTIYYKPVIFPFLSAASQLIISLFPSNNCCLFRDLRAAGIQPSDVSFSLSFHPTEELRCIINHSFKFFFPLFTL